mmetsp:Transcript_89592/g.277108  ORF Transcript_89592/g.277108 Transcript_89592/m.277108 type:complete len:90 (+) Transcript_89592:754-1023(+)
MYLKEACDGGIGQKPFHRGGAPIWPIGACGDAMFAADSGGGTNCCGPAAAAAASTAADPPIADATFSASGGDVNTFASSASIGDNSREL